MTYYNRYTRLDNFKRQLVQEHELSRTYLKTRIRDEFTPIWQKVLLQTTLNSLPKDSSRVRTRNRCVLTGRPRGVLRKFKMSRIAFRNLASRGAIPGVHKATF